MREEQRQRLLEVALEELAARGYSGSSLGSVLERSGTSEAEFRGEYADLDECLFAAYEELGKRAREMASAGCAAGRSWPERVQAGLLTLLEAIAARPEMAELATREFPAIRPQAYERYTRLISSFVPFMREGRELSEAGEELPEDVELLAIGAAESLIFSELEAGRARELPSMAPQILFSVLVPFLGPERAGEEMRSAAVG